MFNIDVSESKCKWKGVVKRSPHGITLDLDSEKKTRKGIPHDGTLASRG